MQTLADSFGMIGYDVLGIGESLVSLISDVIGLGGGFGGGGLGGGAGQYPFG
ncbi:hypothetical protein ACIP5Y_31810 [Nocardia sp. NPDC088792]|uniref:hypothetical protein n=1 Tax=Nocardia sp. NPDC088792 TaxID=3364332 RepID=UPI0037F74DF2